MLMSSTQIESLVFRETLSNRINDLTGKRFGKLIVLGLEQAGGRHPQWYCKCDCGNILKTRGFQLLNNRATSCGCNHRKDLTGKRQGRLTFQKPTGVKNKFGKYIWKALCDCGNVVLVESSTRNKSCGCLGREKASKRMTTHGHAKNGTVSPTYKSWRSMIDRCSPNDSFHKKFYYDRGIRVCKRWKSSFENFLLDMGKRPKGKTLDRIDPAKDYKPSNCRWASSKTQFNNRRIQNAIKIAKAVEQMPSPDAKWIADAIRNMFNGDKEIQKKEN